MEVLPTASPRAAGPAPVLAAAAAALLVLLLCCCSAALLLLSWLLLLLLCCSAGVAFCVTGTGKMRSLLLFKP
jgi:hypothetical protein